MTEPKRIVILGGGTTGWLAAAYLDRVLGQRGLPVAITVIAAEEIGVIGVGEATVPTLRQTLQAIGVPEWQFLAETDATFKNGILFRNWRLAPADAPEEAYFHLFESPPPFEGAGPIAHWLSARAADPATPPYAEATSVQAAFCRAALAPRSLADPEYLAPLSYAYHLDAVKFGAFLRRVATGRGVRHIDDRVEDVALDAECRIAALRTRRHGDIAGDFFIDCSGFAALLIERALGEPLVSFADALFCDSAVALPVPYAGQPSPRAHTTATARSAGWIWEIDLMSRRGTGYVYASRFLSPEAAEAELRGFLGPAAEGHAARHLGMRIGRRRNVWVRNCLSLGLAAGFVEPLESTGIYLVEMGVQLFLDHFHLGGDRPLSSAAYNRAMADLFDHIRDFVVLHYCLSARDDTPFWRAVTDERALPPRVLGWLDLWAEKAPSLTDIDANQMLFLAPHNYFSILAGLDYLPRDAGAAALVPPDSARRFLEVVAAAKARALEAALPHGLYLEKLRGAAIARPAG